MSQYYGPEDASYLLPNSSYILFLHCSFPVFPLVAGAQKYNSTWIWGSQTDQVRPLTAGKIKFTKGKCGTKLGEYVQVVSEDQGDHCQNHCHGWSLAGSRQSSLPGVVGWSWFS